MAKYKIRKHNRVDADGNPDSANSYEDILDQENNWAIPKDEGNRHYQEYLEWKAEGNEPEAADDTLTWDDIRSKRDSILVSTDWTMTTGATVDQAQWAAYRQSIRDLPQTYKDKTPDDVDWPTQPSTAGPNT